MTNSERLFKRFEFETIINSTIKLLIFQLIEKDVNPFVDEWEQQGAFPAHQVFKKFGEAGLLGITRPTG